MTYSTFKEYFAIGAKLAQDIALANGLNLATAQLFASRAKAEQAAPLTVKAHNF